MTVDGKTIGLALSGGGFRATLFALGSLWRLNDAEILGRLDRMTSVSGGSIAMGILAHRWKSLTFVNGRATNFPGLIARPIGGSCSRTMDFGAGLWGALRPFKPGGISSPTATRRTCLGTRASRACPSLTVA